MSLLTEDVGQVLVAGWLGHLTTLNSDLIHVIHITADRIGGVGI